MSWSFDTYVMIQDWYVLKFVLFVLAPLLIIYVAEERQIQGVYHIHCSFSLSPVYIAY